MSEADLILKQGVGGRVFVPAGRRIELVQEFGRSGLSAPKEASERAARGEGVRAGRA